MSTDTRPWDGSIVRYPDPAIQVLDEDRFGSFKIGNAGAVRKYLRSRDDRADSTTLPSHFNA